MAKKTRDMNEVAFSVVQAATGRADEPREEKSRGSGMMKVAASTGKPVTDGSKKPGQHKKDNKTK